MAGLPKDLGLVVAIACISLALGMVTLRSVQSWAGHDIFSEATANETNADEVSLDWLPIVWCH